MTTTPIVQEIEISKIQPNPQNPRHVITPEMVESLARSISSLGLLNPVKVVKVSSQLSVTSSQKDSQQDTPEAEQQFMLISGHIRLSAMQKLGKGTIPALVLDRTPEQALLEAILDNRGQEMTWFDLYLSIESIMALDSNQTQQEIGDKLEITKSTVNRALKLLELLDPVSRTQIVQNLNKSDSYKVSENAVFRLTDLGENPNLIQSALKVVLDLRMTEPQVKKLVAWVKAGNDPSNYDPHSPREGAGSQADRYTNYWKNLPQEARMHKTAKGYRLVWDLSEAEAPVVAYGGMTWLSHLKDQCHKGQYDPQYQDALAGLVTQGVQVDAAAEKAKAEQECLKTEATQRKQAEKTAKAQAREEAKKAKLELAAQKKAAKAHANSPMELTQPKHAPRPEGSAQVASPTSISGGLDLDTLENVAKQVMSGGAQDLLKGLFKL